MKKFKTKKILALLVVGAVMTTAAAGIAMSRNFGSAAFADTEIEGEVTGVPGSLTNPVPASLGENTITKMVVNANMMLNFKELVYYMTFTPAQSGLYSFTHNNPDVGVAEIFSEEGTIYGDWDGDMTVYTIELTADVAYTILINNFDWSINLEECEDGEEVTLPVPATIDIAYKGAAAGRTRETALPYTIGDTIYVFDNKEVWYKFSTEEATSLYLISINDEARVYRSSSTRNPVTAIKGSKTFTADGEYYICVTASEESYVEVQVLEVSAQTAGSCIATAQAIPENGVVGGGKWYTYTVGESEETISLTPTDDAPVVETEYKDEEGNVVFVDRYTVVGSVKVYDDYKYIDNLYDGGTLTLEAGHTYQFFAPDDIYEVWNDEGEVVTTYNVQSKLVIG